MLNNYKPETKSYNISSEKHQSKKKITFELNKIAPPPVGRGIAVDFHPSSLRHSSRHIRAILNAARLIWIDVVMRDFDVKVREVTACKKFNYTHL